MYRLQAVALFRFSSVFCGAFEKLRTKNFCHRGTEKLKFFQIEVQISERDFIKCIICNLLFFVVQICLFVCSLLCMPEQIQVKSGRNEVSFFFNPSPNRIQGFSSLRKQVSIFLKSLIEKEKQNELWNRELKLQRLLLPKNFRGGLLFC